MTASGYLRALALLWVAACTRTPAPPAGTDAGEPRAPSPSASASASAQSHSESAGDNACGGGLGTDEELRAAKPGASTTIAALMKEGPKSGRFTVEGYAQAPIHCGECPPGAACKPCVDTVFFSEAKAAYKGPISEDSDLRVRVLDARKFETAVKYRITINVCPSGSLRPLSNVEIRGYQRLER